MKKLRKIKNTKSTFKVRTGTVEDFFSSVKIAMQAADKGELIKKSHTLTFENPVELLHFLSAAKLNLINSIRKHPDSITNLAKSVNRNRASVYRDISELEKVGIVKIYDEINPGHGHHKIVKITAQRLTLEASI